MSQFGPRSGLTECQSWSGSKKFDTLIVFLKELFENVNFVKKKKKINRRQQKHQRLLNMPRVSEMGSTGPG